MSTERQDATDPFDSLMAEAFPDGVPEPDAVVVGDDHTTYHLLEALVQAYDMLGAYKDLNPQVAVTFPEWVVLQEHAGRLPEALRSAYAWAQEHAGGMRHTCRPAAWLREIIEAASVALARWLCEKGIPQVFLWVQAEGHGMVPFIVQCRHHPGDAGPE